MRLLKLYANKPTFHTVTFNKYGLSLVIGKKKDPEDRNKEHSFNGVGKSLLLYLVDFCLGNEISKKSNIEEKLPEWIFTLEFELKGRTYKVSRSTNSQRTILLNNDELKLKEYREWLGQELFNLPLDVKSLTYRSLIGLFIRQGKSAYISYDQTSKKERPYQRLLRNAYLLGLDVDLVDRKRQLREESSELEGLQKSFKKDSFLKEFFLKGRDVGLELLELENKINYLNTEIKNFRIAENYEEIEQEAEKNRIQWRKFSNERHLIEQSLRQISNSLKEQPEISYKEVETTYLMALTELPEMVKQRLKDVEHFHNKLVESRTIRLNQEKRRLEQQLYKISNELYKLDEMQNTYLKFLNEHGKLQEYEAILNKLSELRRQAEKLKDYKRLEEQFRQRLARNKIEKGKEDIRTMEYLENIQNLTNKLSERFRVMAQRIYPGKTSGLAIRLNSGDNLNRFDIDAGIYADTSDAVGESKLFCFDMTVLLEGKNHNLAFLMHDSRLYSDIDPRQRVELFRIAKEYTEQYNLQYIASLNEDNLEGMRKEMDPTEYHQLFNKENIVIELTDDSDEEKLLGISVDLIYNEG